MRRNVAATFFEHRHYRGHAFLEFADIYSVQLCHHHVWRVSLDDALEHFVLDDDFAKAAEFLVTLLDESRSDFSCLLVRCVNELLNHSADLRNGIHARMGGRRDNASLALFQPDVVILPVLLVGFTEQLGGEPDVVRKDDDLMVSSQSDDAVADLMDAAIIHACYRIIEDHGRGSGDGRDLCQKISQGKSLLFAFRKNLSRFE